MWIGLPKLVASVSNAGGLGVLTGLTPGSPEKLRESKPSCRHFRGNWMLTEYVRLLTGIREVRTLTDKPL